MGRKSKTDPDAISHLAHDALILHLFQLFNHLEEQKELGQVRRKTNEAAGIVQMDPRTIQTAIKKGITSPKSAKKIADALSKKLVELMEGFGGIESGGAERLLDEMKTSLVWSDPARAFQWLEARIADKRPPFIHQDDIIINRNDRHLVDEYHISLAVAPCPNGMTDISFSDKPLVQFKHKTISLLKYSIIFSRHNRNFVPDFILRYNTNEGMLSLIEPTPDRLKDPASYRRNRNLAILAPNPRSSEQQRLSMLIYGGFDKDELRNHSEERAHFSFMQALYRRITFTLDLSAYPEGSVSDPHLFVVSKIPGLEFDCCAMNNAGAGQTANPKETVGQRYVWHFESFEREMIGVHWKVDYAKLPDGLQVSQETLIALLGNA